MSWLINSVYNAVTSNYLVDALHNKISSLVSNVSAKPTIMVTPVATVGLLGINLASMAIGEATSQVTRGYVQLNNFVPKSIRDFLRKVGVKIVHYNDKVDNQISTLLGVDKDLLGVVITGPIFEELLFRLPLLLASWQISDFTSEFFCSSILEGIIDITGAQATMAVLAILSSVAFIYVHDNKPSPDRAAGVFGVGLTLSYLALSKDGGLGNAIVAHMIHNFTGHCCGNQKIAKRIPPKDPEQEDLSVI